MVIYNCYNITRLHQYFYILKKYGKAFFRSILATNVPAVSISVFFLSCSTDNEFMKPVNVGYALINSKNEDIS